MDFILSILGFGVSFILGFFFPRKMGWLVLATFPLLYAMYAVLLPSTFFPLTGLRFSFAVTVGILLSNISKDFTLRYLLQSRFVILFIIFVTYTTYLKLNEPITAIVGTYIPGYFLCIVLPFIIIRNKNDLYKLVKIFVWQGCIIGFFIVLEYFTEINPYDYFLPMREWMASEGNHALNLQEVLSVRGGFKRVEGLAGNAVDTGYLLAFYFPLSVWFLSQKKTLYIFPFAFICAGIILLQTRASFFAIAVAMVFMIYYLLVASRKDFKILKFLNIRFVFVLVFLTGFTLIVFPQLKSIVTIFLVNIFSEEQGYGIVTKVSRLPIAYGHFINNPFGYGSPNYAYSILMQTDDIPAPVVYFLSGGVVLGSLYLLMLWTIQRSVFNILKNFYADYREKLFLILIGCGMISAIVVLFSNWREKHLLTAFILYISVYKIYYLIPRFKPDNNTL